MSSDILQILQATENNQGNNNQNNQNNENGEDTGFPYFTKEHFEVFNHLLMEKDRVFYYNYYNKLGTVDSSGPMQIFILLSKFGELALKHKELILSKYIELIREQRELISAYLRVVEAGAGNISPAGNITAILTTVINFINLGTLTSTLGDMQGEFMNYAGTPLVGFISEIGQATEDIIDENLETFYNTMKEAVILPDKILR